MRLGERVSDKKLFALKFFKNASINDIQSAEKVRKKQSLRFHPYREYRGCYGYNLSHSS